MNSNLELQRFESDTLCLCSVAPTAKPVRRVGDLEHWTSLILGVGVHHPVLPLLCVYRKWTVAYSEVSCPDGKAEPSCSYKFNPRSEQLCLTVSMTTGRLQYSSVGQLLHVKTVLSAQTLLALMIALNSLFSHQSLLNSVA